VPLRNKAFAERVRKRRGARSLAEIGDGVKVTPQAIHGYEQGRIPRGEILERLAAFYGVTVRWLLTGDDGTGQVAEPPEPYGDLERSDKRVLDDVADLLRAGDEAARSDLKRALDLVRRAAQLPRKRA